MILVLNCGSSSVKFQLIEIATRRLLAKGLVSRISMRGAQLTYEVPGREILNVTGEILDHGAAIANILDILTDKEYGVISDKSVITGVGHRVVHGGEFFSDSVLITKDVLDKISQCNDYAPLHNPHNIKGIIACQQILANVPNIAVFDTAFHHHIPDYAYRYGIPTVFYKKHGIRRYGFHGTSHYYVSHRVQELMRNTFISVITCHLGNGCSITAVKDGKSIDTSMGFTPLEGLLMGTRSGDIDAAVVLQIMQKERMNAVDATAMLNKFSGLLGVSGVSNDMRDIESEISKGNEDALLAHNIFCYRLKKYIGAYYTALGGANAIVFTGGIGENSVLTREKTLEGLECIGIFFDKERNKKAVGCEMQISTNISPTKVFVIPTNEELVIAVDTAKLIK